MRSLAVRRSSAGRAHIHPAGFVFPIVWVIMLLLADSSSDDLGITIAISMLAVLGAYLVAKRPEYRLGWVLAWTSAIAGLAGFTNNYVEPFQETMTPFEGFISSGIGAVTWTAMFWTGLGLVLLLFPTGKPPSPRWRWVAVTGWLSVAVAIPLAIFTSQWCMTWTIDTVTDFETCVANPYGIEGVPGPDVMLTLTLVAIVGAAVSAVFRFRRSQGLERRQMKVFVLGASVIVAWIGVLFALGPLLDGADPPAYFEHLSNLVLWTALPIAMAVAILRHGLYEIDRIISRTVAYLLVLLLLGSAFAAVVAGVPTLVGLDSSLAVAGATLGAFLLFSPLLQRIQKRVDRVFNRLKYDPDQVAATLSVRIRDEIDPSGLASSWAESVQDTFQPASIGLWIR